MNRASTPISCLLTPILQPSLKTLLKPVLTLLTLNSSIFVSCIILLRWRLAVVRVSMRMRVWPVHILSFKFATYCVSYLFPWSYSYRISSVLQFNEVVGRARECKTFSNRSIVLHGSGRPEHCICGVYKITTVVKIITYN